MPQPFLQAALYSTRRRPSNFRDALRPDAIRAAQAERGVKPLLCIERPRSGAKPRTGAFRRAWRAGLTAGDPLLPQIVSTNPLGHMLPCRSPDQEPAPILAAPVTDAAETLDVLKEFDRTWLHPRPTMPCAARGLPAAAGQRLVAEEQQPSTFAK
jgi:hypothetical protein